MADITISEYLKLAVPIITTTGGVVVAAVKYGLNGSKKAIAETNAEVKEMRRDLRTVDGRLIRVETKLDNAKIALDVKEAEE